MNALEPNRAVTIAFRKWAEHTGILQIKCGLFISNTGVALHLSTTWTRGFLPFLSSAVTLLGQRPDGNAEIRI